MTTTNNDLLFVLGANDPEMQAIERLLQGEGVAYAYAVGPDGGRVHPGNAYTATHYSSSAPAPGTTIVFVECDVPDLRHAYECLTIDHHRPGDPGYGRPPAAFWAASSVGQVISLLCDDSALHPEFFDNLAAAMESGSYVPESERTYVLAAAADHCLAAAYRGECPGVDPDELMVWRVAQRAAHQGRSVEEVLADVNAARGRLREQLPGDGFRVADMRSAHVPELPEAAIREGVAYLATVTDRDGRVKEVLGGHTTPELVREWMESRRAEGREVYGDPARGFAGAYVG